MEFMKKQCDNCGETVEFRDITADDAWQLAGSNFYQVRCPECNNRMIFEIEARTEEDDELWSSQL